jgi:hypothetical protein
VPVFVVIDIFEVLTGVVEVSFCAVRFVFTLSFELLEQPERTIEKIKRKLIES